MNEGGAFVMAVFLWILFTAGTPDLYDAIMFALTDGQEALPTRNLADD